MIYRPNFRRAAFVGAAALATLVVADFNCLAPDFSHYQKCSAAELACNTYCGGTGLALCLQAAHAHNFPREACATPE
jgi:hypothetical protein